MLSVDLKESDARPALPPFGLLPPVPAGQNFDWAALLTECGALVAEQYDLIAFLDNKRTNTQVRVLLTVLKRQKVAYAAPSRKVVLHVGMGPARQAEPGAGRVLPRHRPAADQDPEQPGAGARDARDRQHNRPGVHAFI